MSFSLSFTAHSEVGRIRKNNQDAGYASPTMLLVADGMGGAAAGDLASAVAATEAARSDCPEVRDADGEEMLERIAGMIARSNAKLTDLIESNLELDGMGTTFCGALFNGTQFGLAHVGDSRGYLLRDGELTQLTHDHSWVQSLIDEGKITEEQAATHPHRSLILKVLNGQVHFEPDLDVFDAQLGDRLMFCSDGLSGLVDDAHLHELLADPSREAAVEQLAKLANDNGGHDNITIVIGDVVEQDDSLDAAPSTLVGSAVEVEIPRTGGPVATPAGAGYPTPPSGSDVVVEHSPDEAARYAPTEDKPRWPGIIATVLAIALVIGGGWWATSSYVSSRYFIAADDEHVAVFNGLPGAMLGLQLNNLVERTDIPVDNLPRFYRDEVETAINVGSFEAAERTVGSLRDLAENCVAIRAERRAARETPSPEPEPPSPSPSAPVTELPAPGVDDGPGLPTNPPQMQTTQTASPAAPAAPNAPATAKVPDFLSPFTPDPVETPSLAEELASLEPGPGEEADLEDC